MLVSTDRLEWGTEVMFSCEPGYLYWDQTARKSSECLPFGKWSSVEPPICSRKYFFHIRVSPLQIYSLAYSFFYMEIAYYRFL